MEKIFLGWADVSTLVNEMHKDTCHLDTDQNAIIGVARGGLIPAVMLSHLKNNIPVHVIGTKSYNNTKRENDTIYQSLNTEDIQKYSKIFVVDDICDTGNTFVNLKNNILHPNLISCSIVHRHNAIYTPDHYGVQLLDEKWVVFPWESHK